MKKILFQYGGIMGISGIEYVNITIDINKNHIVEYYISGNVLASKNEGSLDEEGSRRFINLINESNIEHWNDHYEPITAIDGPYINATIVKDNNEIDSIDCFYGVKNN